MPEKLKLKVDNQEVAIYSNKEGRGDYISLTDMARFRDSERSDYIIQNRIRTRYAIEFLGLWENLNNESFKSIEFDGFKTKVGNNSFSLTPQRGIRETGAIGIEVKKGRYGGGVFAHKDIAFEFGSWLSPALNYILYRIINA